MLQFTGNAPVEVTKFEKEAMRCNRCGREFMSDQKINKWAHSARSSIVMQKNFGMPFYRLAKLQSFYGVPIAKSTLWEQCSGVWGEAGQHVYNHLLELAAQSEKLNADDTGVTILEVQKNNKSRPAKDKKGCHTTVILASHKDKKIALYISADRHCGHNLKNLLLMKGDRNDKVKLMTDALSCNTAFIPETGVDVVESKCLTHGRRKFCELEKFYPEECKYFLGEIGNIYHNEKECKNYGMAERLEYHQQNSKKHIDNIYARINFLFDNKQVEPNGSLGRAMKYWLNHKKGLSKFLEVAGVDLDNNSAEQALKDIILQRKNSLFHNSLSSALVLSGLSSIIKTCTLNNVNVFNYLNWIQDHGAKVARSPEEYMPWHSGLSPPITGQISSDRVSIVN